ncbi:cytochrome oxidase assembly protein [Natrialbaceae archaeon AArc-T1-2]|uniref:cytochrome oxidase assembly protein n=1 Tax=Natrialbaceae archaeon AArc-T1-2 TaxID=3053904 RepID=UPI00255AB9DB|nr:cytochrome oxidase assembly protein [Natrialbaceae archaeon AArc-T1-2]WIV66722.1 cytochrome oxidase assembly protein [Natrialbaceae archaeon AArc-T1-2]
MSYDSYTPGSSDRSFIDRLGFSHLLATTIVLITATILLGVATRAYGAGLACDANWPFCDAGPYNLFPASFPSFWEWIHRFVSMFAGFAIVATAIAAMRSSRIDRVVTGAVVLGAVLTPIQVYLGRETVLSYNLEVLNLHFWTAVLIFVLFAVATVLVWMPRLTARHVTTALAVGLVALPLHVGLSSAVLGDVTQYSPATQTAQYAVTLALFGAVIVATIVGRRRLDDARTLAVVTATPILAVLVVFFGRHAVVTFPSTIAFQNVLSAFHFLSAAVLFVVFAVGIRLTRTASTGRAATRL